MPKCRHSASFLIALVVACAGNGRPALVGPLREQPAVLVGRWMRAPDATPRTNEVLVLRADGVQWMEAPIDSAHGELSRVGPRAWWWIYRGAGGGPDRLCLHWRAGRHAADCARYEIDTVRTTAGTVVRLRWADERFHAAPPSSVAPDQRR